ncbi:MAG: hypothetical protein RMJ97_09915 [Raineya sp.]|nr:hypothetical protein [Raineya sp.]
MSKFVKTLTDLRKDLKSKALLLANSRQMNEKPNATLKSIINEALEIGLSIMIDKEKENLGALFQNTTDIEA